MMNHSTMQKIVAGVFLGAASFSAVQAQETPPPAAATQSGGTIFGGRSKYRSWNIQVNAGVLTPWTGVNIGQEYKNYEMDMGYGLTIRKQLAHSFGLELSGFMGKVKSTNDVVNVRPAVGAAVPTVLNGAGKDFVSTISWAGTLMGTINVATIDFLKRANYLNFLLKAGAGAMGYKTVAHDAANRNLPGTNVDQMTPMGALGAGIKIKVTNRVNFDLGYNVYFVEQEFNGVKTTSSGTLPDRFSYGYAGIEVSIGSGSKPSLDWANPVAMMYDELKDNSLRQEVEALKARVTTLESLDLLKDSDGDGVADKLDKCPSTEAGIKVDGSGCPLDVDADGIPDSRDACPTEKGTPELNGCSGAVRTTMAPESSPRSASSNSNIIQFEFNSSVLTTSSYPALDDLATSLKGKSSAKVRLEGHASSEGTDEYNMALSKDRANSVKTYLVNAGVKASRVATKGFGETRPISTNNTEEGRIKNRRVEIKK